MKALTRQFSGKFNFPLIAAGAQRIDMKNQLNDKMKRPGSALDIGH
ncbi:MAG: hypothetical protein JXL81_11765 [Deltaproteobacteria bacterium]|nr:hypothetical protein [Deltaproteobacteria bacterium]